MDLSHHPLIAITCGGKADLPNQPDLYINAVTDAGGIADFIFPDDDLRDLTDRYSGFIIPGGMDLAPGFYGEKRLYKISRENPERIRFELSLLHEIIKKNKPVLGICYGMQLINVFLRGDLYQDIRSQISTPLQHSGGVHMIAVSANPYMSEGEYEVNSTHHQAVRKIGKGLKPFSNAPDGIREAFYAEGNSFLIGVQWHPERMEGDFSRQIFRSLVAACL